jgi:hypothetical protein
VQRRQLAAEAVEEFGPLAAEAFVADDAVGGGYAFDAADEGEGLSDDLQVVAVPKRFGRGDAGFEGRA